MEEEKFIRVGIFWAIPNREEGGWEFRVLQRSYPSSSEKELANSVGIIDPPYSHYGDWEEARKESEPEDCYFYPRGRILYDVKRHRHRIFADACLDVGDLDEILEYYDIEDYVLCRDEHYVSAYTKRGRPKPRPVLNYQILRGREKIGENLIEITYDKTKLLVELGKALEESAASAEIEEAVLKKKYDAVLISHYHADHAGRIEQKRDCPIYIGAGAKRILEAMDEYRGRALPPNIAAYRSGRTFRCGQIFVTPYLCDHSAFDSYMLLFEAGGRRILYTGDFRFHGRKIRPQRFAAR